MTNTTLQRQQTLISSMSKQSDYQEGTN